MMADAAQNRTDTQSGDTLPVFVPAWILQDGAHRYPEDGSEVRCRLEFAEVADPSVWHPHCLFTGRAVPRRLSSAQGDSGQTWDGRQRPPRWPTILDFGQFEAFTTFGELRTKPGVATGLLAVGYELGGSPVKPIRGRVRQRRLVTEVSEPESHTLIAVELARLTEIKPWFKDGLVQSDQVTERNGHRFYRTAPPTDRPWRRDTGILLDIAVMTLEGLAIEA